ncbi:MAG: hypothetical protein EA422_06800 [Gemmatimonadales bacterium]|nr:MAG: hypothetical protein EA422_06800 [Gemmatimonadales bacterium]
MPLKSPCLCRCPGRQRRSTWSIVLLAALALLLQIPTAPALEAQGITLDEGTFTLYLDGREVGTETFAIRRSGEGPQAQIIATAEIQMEVPEGRLDLRPALQAAGADMEVSAYQIRISGHMQEEIYVTLGDRRFRTSVRSERGEQEREYRATPGTVLLDTGVAHQYFFISARMGTSGGSVPILIPREGVQYDLQVSVVGTERIQIGGTSLDARHLRLEGRGETRDLWVDGEYRILRLEHPAEGYVAERQSLP